MQALTPVTNKLELLDLPFNVSFATNTELYNMLCLRNIGKHYVFADLTIEENQLLFTVNCIREQYERLYDVYKTQLDLSDRTTVVESGDKNGVKNRNDRLDVTAHTSNTGNTNTNELDVAYDSSTPTLTNSENGNSSTVGDSTRNQTGATNTTNNETHSNRTQTVRTAGTLDRIAKGFDVASYNILENYIKEFDKFFYIET